MNINDIVLRKDLPINISIAFVSIIISAAILGAANKASISLKNNTKIQTEKNSILQEIKSISSSLETVKKNFWQDNAFISGEFYDQLQNKLQELEAYDILIIVEPIENKVAYGMVPLKVTFKLDYKSILSFLKFTEEHPKVLKIQYVNLKKVFTKPEDEDNRLDAEILLQAFCLKEK